MAPVIIINNTGSQIQVSFNGDAVVYSINPGETEVWNFDQPRMVFVLKANGESQIFLAEPGQTYTIN